MSTLQTIAEKEIPATPMIEHGSWGSRPIGTYTSSLTLYNWGDPFYYQIEWIIDSDDEMVEHIGLWFEVCQLTPPHTMPPKPGEGKSLIDYDGIMAMPDIAVTFLREQGFTIPEEFES